MTPAAVLAALDPDVVLAVDAEQPDRGIVGGAGAEPQDAVLDRDRQARLPTRRQQVDRLAHASALRADDVDPPPDHHLRRVQAALARAGRRRSAAARCSPRGRRCPASPADPNRSRGSSAAGRPDATSSSPSTTSAGGQELQPWEVKSSTTIGGSADAGPAASPPACAGEKDAAAMASIAATRGVTGSFMVYLYRSGREGKPITKRR